jgi:hypothetical protein
MPDSARAPLTDELRDRIAEALGRHFVAGRIDSDALTQRVDAVYGAQFADEAEAAVADLPRPDAPAPPSGKGRHSWFRRRGHGESERAQPGWRPTPERFQDPTTDRIMRVWIDPADGKRHYVAEAPT